MVSIVPTCLAIFSCSSTQAAASSAVGAFLTRSVSAAYAARYVAKNIVAAKIASKCEVQLAYAIGVAHPVSVMVDTFGTGKYDDEKIAEAVNAVFDLRPSAIIDKLDLLW